MAKIQGDYWQFYLQGRGEKRLLKNDIDEGTLAEEMVRTGELLRDVILAACVRAAAPFESGKARGTWKAEHATEIGMAGGNSDAAYAAYLQGRVDELAYGLEESVLEALGDHFGDDDSDDTEGGEEEDDAEGDE